MPRSTIEADPDAPVAAYIGLGANLGDALANLRSAFTQIGNLALTEVVARSPMYRSTPIDSSGPDYINAVLCVSTRLAPLELLAHLLAIERAHGRERPYRNAPRSLDLDLLLYGDRMIDLPQLSVPHPRMQERGFVLKPLADIAPKLVVPGHGALVSMLARVSDQDVTRLEA
jgi:2-amino-4-hydroxy-6-hydroxymethyldihydropteridine diphosphokinase